MLRFSERRLGQAVNQLPPATSAAGLVARFRVAAVLSEPRAFCRVIKAAMLSKRLYVAPLRPFFLLKAEYCLLTSFYLTSNIRPLMDLWRCNRSLTAV